MYYINNNKIATNHGGKQKNQSIRGTQKKAYWTNAKHSPRTTIFHSWEPEAMFGTNQEGWTYQFVNGSYDDYF